MAERGDARGYEERRLARETAMVVLYEADSVNHPAGEALERRLTDEEAPIAEAAARRARTLVSGVLKHQAEIDERISAAAPNFPLAQMAPIEKSILRVALFEVLFDNRRVPLRAAISEAVELAKIFGGDSAPRFVNGVLSTIAAAAETPAARTSDEPRPTPTEERER